MRKADEVDPVSDTSADHTSLDGEEEDGKASGQDDEANILAATHLMRADISTQIREVITSNQETKEVLAVFSERLTLAETHISKA